MLCRKICEHLHRALNMFELLHDCDETEASFSPVHLLTASEYTEDFTLVSRSASFSTASCVSLPTRFRMTPANLLADFSATSR